MTPHTDCARGEDVFIPKLQIVPRNVPFQFWWLQFLLHLAFAKSINKAYRQSLRVSDIHLEVNCFLTDNYMHMQCITETEIRTKHIYIHLRTYQKFCVSRDIILNATWLYMFNQQWTLYRKLHSKRTYYKCYDFVLRLEVKIIHSEKVYIMSLSLFLPCCFHCLLSS